MAPLAQILITWPAHEITPPQPQGFIYNYLNLESYLSTNAAHWDTGLKTDTANSPYDAVGQFGGLVQERDNSSALAMELRLSCTNSSNCIKEYGIEYVSWQSLT